MVIALEPDVYSPGRFGVRVQQMYVAGPAAGRAPSGPAAGRRRGMAGIAFDHVRSSTPTARSPSTSSSRSTTASS